MFRKQSANAELQDAVNRLLLEMKNTDPTSTEYATLVARLSDLTKIKPQTPLITVSQDTIATIAANLAGIWLILHYEQVNLVGSKALTFVQKLR